MAGYGYPVPVTTPPPPPGQPPYPPPGYTPPPGYGLPPGYPAYVMARPTNGLAIAAMVVALVGFGPVGAILGHVARRQIRERGEQGDGFALAGIIVGWISTGFLVAWLLLLVFLISRAGAPTLA